MSSESIPFEPWRKWWSDSPFAVSMAAGAVAGLTVDLTLYPIDTMKTRLQAPEGFIKSGGISNIYRGLPIALIGSMPASAVFFTAYESARGPIWECFAFLENCFRQTLHIQTDDSYWSSTDGIAPENPTQHMLVNAVAAAWGELLASSIRTPIEALKQGRQALSSNHKHVGQTMVSEMELFPHRWTSLWAGWGPTVARDVPFAIIQYPLYHATKHYASGLRNDKESHTPLSPHQAALCGSMSAGIAAAITTPFDVAQTHIMLSTKQSREAGASLTTRGVLTRLYASDGLRGLWRGAGARVVWMSVGGLIFLGSYEQAKVSLNANHEHLSRRLSRKRNT